MMKGCNEFKAVHNLDVGCCDSCHEDMNMGISCIEVENDKLEVEYHICCAVYNEWNDRK